jgi:hypothetical protein
MSWDITEVEDTQLLEIQAEQQSVLSTSLSQKPPASFIDMGVLSCSRKIDQTITEMDLRESRSSSSQKRRRTNEFPAAREAPRARIVLPRGLGKDGQIVRHVSFDDTTGRAALGVSWDITSSVSRKARTPACNNVRPTD